MAILVAGLVGMRISQMTAPSLQTDRTTGPSGEDGPRAEHLVR